MSKAPLPYGIVPSEAYDDRRMTLALLGVLGAVASHCYQGQSRWGQIEQSIIAKRLGLSREHVNRCVKSLVEWGYLLSRQQEAQSGARIMSAYQVNLQHELEYEHYRLPPDAPEYGAPPVIVESHPPVMSRDHTPVMSRDHSLNRKSENSVKSSNEMAPQHKNKAHAAPDPDPEPDAAGELVPRWPGWRTWGRSPEGREWMRARFYDWAGSDRSGVFERTSVIMTAYRQWVREQEEALTG